MTKTTKSVGTPLDVLSFTAPSSASVEALRQRLQSSADYEGILDIAYRTIDSPVGTLLLAATPKGLLRIAFESEGVDSVLVTLGQRVSPRILRSPRRLDTCARELEDYFAGRRFNFNIDLDHTLSSGFRLLVQEHLSDIAYGETKSYQQVAALVGSPKASRAVGTACATNPLPIVVPCHRVLRSNGDLGGYLGGLAMKTALLELEKANYSR